jgi:E3 ubiquitin-protein ligase RNF115/126
MPRGPPLNPIMALFGQMMAGNGQAGDAVYSQEALDRIISQLMEQNTSSNAPAPASQDDINSLPRKHVTVDMLGPEGTAECSICMEEVNIGEEVAELPCHHWFHHGCVAMWLGEHNTCPHCRKGITKDGDSNANQNQSSNNQSNNGAPSNPPSRTMPGSFNAGDVVGDGSARNPYVVAGSAEEDRINHQTRSGSADDTGAGGGFGERLRRGLFGPPQ